MDVKLTLSMDEAVIKRAKTFAQQNHTSLSQVIENYLSNLTADKGENNDNLSPLVKSLSGVLRMPDDYNYKEDRSKYLTKKHGV